MRHGITHENIRSLVQEQTHPPIGVYTPGQTPTIKNPVQQENALRVKTLEREAGSALEQ